MTPLIEISDGFFLSRICRNDKAAYLEHFTDPEIANNLLAVPFPYTEADADWWLNHCESRACEPETMFAIREASGFLIGAIGIVDELPANAYRAEFGYWLARKHRGKGLMPRVIRSFASHAFQQIGLHRLYATPFSPNLASQRTLEKAGFVREGHLRQHYRKGDSYLDAILYGLLSQDHRPA